MDDLDEYVLERINNDLRTIIKPDALDRWWDLRIPALGDRTPRQAWDEGEKTAVARVAWGYTIPHGYT